MLRGKVKATLEVDPSGEVEATFHGAWDLNNPKDTIDQLSKAMKIINLQAGLGFSRVTLIDKRGRRISVDPRTNRQGDSE